MFETRYKAFREDFRLRIEETVKGLLNNIFNTRLFEDSYLNPEQSLQEVGKAEYVNERYDA